MEVRQNPSAFMYSPSHGENRGSSPLGSANQIKHFCAFCSPQNPAVETSLKHPAPCLGAADRHTHAAFTLARVGVSEAGAVRMRGAIVPAFLRRACRPTHSIQQREKQTMSKFPTAEDNAKMQAEYDHAHADSKAAVIAGLRDGAYNRLLDALTGQAVPDAATHNKLVEFLCSLEFLSNELLRLMQPPQQAKDDPYYSRKIIRLLDEELAPDLHVLTLVGVLVDRLAGEKDEAHVRAQMGAINSELETVALGMRDRETHPM
jgi:hypothetical protein